MLWRIRGSHRAVKPHPRWNPRRIDAPEVASVQEARMGHRFVQLFTHLIFSTKDRVPFLDAELAPECRAYIGGIVENIGGRRIEIGGVADHIHLLLDLPPTMALSDCVRTIKSNSSKWI